MSTRKPRVEIEYCSQCRFILRASWMAQELLTTFADELGEVALVPGTGGIFEVRLNGEQLWNKKQAGRYPEPKEIKQLIRDRIAPENFSREQNLARFSAPEGRGPGWPESERPRPQ